MTGIPPETLYHRWLDWHAPSLLRAVVAVFIGLAVALILLRFVTWEFAGLGGWDAAALAFLGAVWPIIVRADAPQAEQLATREDESRGSAAVLLVGASVASLLGVGSVLATAGQERGLLRGLAIGFAVLTVVSSWTVINTVYTLHYAHLHYAFAGSGITFSDSVPAAMASYREFAYVAFTIGMTYRFPIRQSAILGSAASFSSTLSFRTCSAW
jgi:uncharacterized membrane protein